MMNCIILSVPLGVHVFGLGFYMLFGRLGPFGSVVSDHFGVRVELSPSRLVSLD